MVPTTTTTTTKCPSFHYRWHDQPLFESPSICFTLPWKSLQIVRQMSPCKGKSSAEELCEGAALTSSCSFKDVRYCTIITLKEFGLPCQQQLHIHLSLQVVKIKTLRTTVLTQHLFWAPLRFLLAPTPTSLGGQSSPLLKWSSVLPKSRMGGGNWMEKSKRMLMGSACEGVQDCTGVSQPS